MGLLKDRILQFIEQEGISIREFERKCKFSNGYTNKIKDFTPQKVKDIVKVFPQLNEKWVLTGESNMLNERLDGCFYLTAESEEGRPINPSREIIHLHKVISDLRQIKPRIPLTATAGALSYEKRNVTLRECEQMPVINRFPFYDFTMFIKGDSMSPKYESGDEIACRWIDHERFIQWGKVHVLDTIQGIIVKKVYEDGDKIRCVSINPDYPPFSIPKKEVYSVSIVVGLVRL